MTVPTDMTTLPPRIGLTWRRGVGQSLNIAIRKQTCMRKNLLFFCADPLYTPAFMGMHPWRMPLNIYGETNGW